MEISEETIMPFGKHSGEKLANVPADYLIYMYDSGKLYGTIRQYVQENEELLRKEVKEIKSKYKQSKYNDCDATESDIY